VQEQRYLPPRLLQAIGLILLIAFAAFWAVTGRESVLLVGAAGSLILLGGYEQARQTLVAATKQPPPIEPPAGPPKEPQA
jgi:hypothetical protein